ncbi:MAG: hypothetical protein AB8B87_20210 [Granulosicoccus sp.]
MNYLESVRALRAVLLCLSVALLITLSACEGGMIGTSAGPAPKPDPYYLRYLPERISPDLPNDVIRGERPTPEQSDIMENESNPMPRVKESNLMPRMNDTSEPRARGWEELNQYIGVMVRGRIIHEGNATIVDLAYDDIRTACDDQLADCTIPEDQIRVSLTQDVIDRLINLYTAWVSISIYETDEAREFALSGIKRVFTSLLDTDVVLGETRYSQGGDMPYDHSVQTTLKRQAFQGDLLGWVDWDNENVDARWVDDGQVVRYVSSTEFRVFEYFYENGEPGEVAVAQSYRSPESESSIGFFLKVVANDRDNAGILVDMAATRGLRRAESSQPDDADTDSDSDSYTGFGYDVVTGQLDNRGGYTSFGTLRQDDNEERTLFYTLQRDSFDDIGTLLAGEGCVWGFSAPFQNCGGQDLIAYGPKGGALTDSVYYFEPDGFDTLLAMQDSIRWEVQGLPTGIQAIAVVSAGNTLPLSDREVLCRGYQFEDEQVRIFCTATDEQLESTVVVEWIDGKIGAVIPEASLEQIQ